MRRLSFNERASLAINLILSVPTTIRVRYEAVKVSIVTTRFRYEEINKLYEYSSYLLDFVGFYYIAYHNIIVACYFYAAIVPRTHLLRIVLNYL